jgi:hypothetical protein
MVHPTTENLKQLGFEIKLLESFRRIPRTFESKTIPLFKPTYNTLDFLLKPGETLNPTTNSSVGYVAAAALPPPVVSPPVVSAAAEPLIKSKPAATAASQRSSVEKTSNSPTKVSAKAIRTNNAVILGARILSNGVIIALGGPHFMVDFENDLVDDKKFIIINKEKIPLGDEGNDSVYTVLE